MSACRQAAMVSTRALSKGSEADTPKKPANATPKKHATVSGRIEKPKRANKTKRKKPGNVMSAEELEFEAELMKQVSLGEVSLQGPCHRHPPRKPGISEG